MTWATEEDLLTVDIPLNGIDTGHFLQVAEDEMVVHIGGFYEFPLPDPLPTMVAALLKIAQARIATGRMLLAHSMLSADLHAYGVKLLEEGQEELLKIGNSVSITGATAAGSTTGTTTTDGTSVPYPSVVTASGSFPEESPFDTYERWAHGLDDSAYVQYP